MILIYAIIKIYIIQTKDFFMGFWEDILFWLNSQSFTMNLQIGNICMIYLGCIWWISMIYFGFIFDEFLMKLQYKLCKVKISVCISIVHINSLSNYIEIVFNLITMWKNWIYVIWQSIKNLNNSHYSCYSNYIDILCTNE